MSFILGTLESKQMNGRYPEVDRIPMLAFLRTNRNTSDEGRSDRSSNTRISKKTQGMEVLILFDMPFDVYQKELVSYSREIKSLHPERESFF